MIPYIYSPVPPLFSAFFPFLRRNGAKARESPGTKSVPGRSELAEVRTVAGGIDRCFSPERTETRQEAGRQVCHTQRTTNQTNKKHAAPLRSTSTSLGWPLRPGTKVWWNSSSAASTVHTAMAAAARFGAEVSQGRSAKSSSPISTKYKNIWAPFRS